jgi:putative transcriptional regulator
LVAVPELSDPHFRQTLVFLHDHGADGSLGLILNRPVGKCLSDLLNEAELPELLRDTPIFYGGPVQPEAVMALGDFVDGNRAAAIAFGSVGFLPADADETLDPATVIRARVFAGYAGWGPGQLEDELEEEAWVDVPAQIDDCFADDPESLWRAAIRRHPGELAVFALEPDDPSLN